MEKQPTSGYEKLPDIFEQFKLVFRQLPIEGCSLESSRHQYLERESGLYEPSFRQFVAPPGKIFKLSGDFEVETDSNDESYSCNTIPMPSVGLLYKRIAENPQEYNDEDHDNPFGSNFYYSNQDFYGKRLSVSIGGYQFGSPRSPNVSNTNNIMIKVEGGTDAYSETGYKTILLEDRTESDFYLPYRYPDPLANIIWKYDIASSPLQNIQIELVDDNLVKPEFVPVYADSQICDEDKIWVPYNINTDSIREYYQSHGVELSDEQMLQEIRFRRQHGSLRIADDPLRDWWFPTNNTSSNIQELVDEVASLKGLENAKNIYFGSNIIEYDTQPEYIDKRHLGKIAIVCGNFPMSQIVKQEQQIILNKNTNIKK